LIQHNNNKLEYLFDNNSNLIISVNEALDESGFYFNSLDKITKTIYPDLSTAEIKYDKLMNLTQIISDRGLKVNIKSAYGVFGTPKSLEYNIDENLKFDFTFNGNNQLKFNNNNLIQKIYDKDNVINSIILNGNQSISYYLENGYSNLKLPNGITYSKVRVDALLDKIIIKNISNQIISEINIHYDFGRNISKITENSEIKIESNYDNFKRLSTFKSNGINNWNISYLNDGRIDSIVYNNTSNSKIYDVFNRMTKSGKFDLVYDQKGNITKKNYQSQSTEYLYDFENRLTCIVKDHNDSTKIHYSPDGNILSIISNDTLFYLP